MALKVAASEKSSVDFWMEGFHPAVANLGKTGYLADIDDFKSCFLQKFHCAAGCDDVPSERLEFSGEFYYASLI